MSCGQMIERTIREELYEPGPKVEKEVGGVRKKAGDAVPKYYDNVGTMHYQVSVWKKTDTSTGRVRYVNKNCILKFVPAEGFGSAKVTSLLKPQMSNHSVAASFNTKVPGLVTFYYKDKSGKLSSINAHAAAGFIKGSASDSGLVYARSGNTWEKHPSTPMQQLKALTGKRTEELRKRLV